MKTYIVTGAASGIGLRIARDLLDAHTKVAIIDVKKIPDEFKEAKQRGDLIYVQGSSADESCVKETMEQIKPWGRLDGLVNNSGIMIRKPLLNLSLEEWNRVINSNLTSAFLFAKGAAPLLKESRGSIINIASTRAHQSEPNTESYAATKGALMALTHALALSLGPEIRVNCISPGWIEVRSSEEQARDPLKASDHAQHPVGRVGRVEDISQFVLFLLSSHSGFITGQEFIIDGGMTRKMIYKD